MLNIIIIIGIFVSIVLFNIIKNAFVGKYYWERCEKRYYNLLRMGYNKKAALIELSKESHPELSNLVHEKIVDKFDTLTKFVLFSYNSLNLPSITKRIDNKKLTDQIALSIIKNTAIRNYKGRIPIVDTDISAVEEECGLNKKLTMLEFIKGLLNM